MFDLFYGSMAAAIALFSLSVLPQRSLPLGKYPFASVMLCCASLSSGPTIFLLLPSLQQLYIGLLPTIFFTFLPSLWLYQETLVSKKPWQWQTAKVKHFASLPFALALTALLITLPSDDFNQMLYSDDAIDSTLVIVTSIYFLCMVILWCCLSLVYTLAIVKRVRHYRKQLNHVFSNQEGKSMRWLNLFSLVTILTWLYGLMTFMFEKQLYAYGIPTSGIFLLLLTMVWLVAANGLSQRPGFEEVQHTDAEIIEVVEYQASDEVDKKAYQRSPLNKDDLLRIAQKLDQSIITDKVHLACEINLVGLSKHIGVPTQYISQTLSQHLSTSFFDFINQARIEEAKILLNSTDQSVLEIAMSTGFNARSSFYKAFKQYTDVTPSQYRKQSTQDKLM